MSFLEFRCRYFFDLKKKMFKQLNKFFVSQAKKKTHLHICNKLQQLVNIREESRNTSLGFLEELLRLLFVHEQIHAKNINILKIIKKYLYTRRLLYCTKINFKYKLTFLSISIGI